MHTGTLQYYWTPAPSLWDLVQRSSQKMEEKKSKKLIGLLDNIASTLHA